MPETQSETARNLFHLCDHIGPRFAGTPGYRAAADYMLSQFQAYGLQNAHLEPFTFNAWRRGEPAQLKLTSPVEQPLACYALPYATSTPPDGFESEVINVGTGTDEAIDALRDQLPGKFALVLKPGRHRMDIYKACVEAGAAGFIFAAYAEGMGLISGSLSDAENTGIPAVSIGREDALKLERMSASATVKLHLNAQHICEPDTTWNVIGEIPGTETSDEFIIVGGHLDSHEIGPGAYDNCAGAVMVMDIARLLVEKRDRLKRTVRCIGFAGEEVGLLGSKYHAEAHESELSGARAMFNCDMPALCPPWAVGYHICPEGEAVIARLGEKLDLEFAAREVKHNHSDHYPFTHRGVPAFSTVGSRPKVGGPKFAHMAGDTPEKIPTEMLADASNVAAQIVLELANNPPARS